ncbi:CoA transferase [Pimelobacter simplex]|uniref:L-carnitine dehydratase/bile acid-inducible protein F n=1 Tax=Nocardioides simplex TaxID=2045 RepID=A0A0A1DQA3_NOCSI|nr:CoA transferase [Pimelobacter simplex]AIY18807.1 L-carnitine dehydratase/bile acid-inducible protein F [Pimelobacter simplex]MCG8152398.1 CoA transferase [Pimelobacter simplex]GEB14511.1 CoA transferase [Pimelobacter simplex]SFM28820.1 Crotonobetainyl-CoA:carnitine CoA-transferase CaiB [Pimelobacter simplex]
MTAAQGPLAGIRVIEAGSMYAAPTAGRMLRDFGAEVIKVEDPAQGDFARQWQPAHEGTAIGFARLNSGKRSVGIDMRRPEGRAVLQRLVADADVLIENFRPGRMEAWGMSYDELKAVNPGLVMTRVSGFGQTGPYRERPGFGTVAETASGYAFLNGWPHTPPTAPPFGFADSIAGISAAYGTAMALFDRGRTGVGSEVDVALYEPLMFILGDAVLNYTSSGEIMQRHGNASGAASPRGIYQAADGGWLSIAGSNQAIAMRLFEAMDRIDLQTDERYATNVARMANNESLQEIVVDWVRQRPRDEVLAILDKFEVVAAAVNDSSDIVADPHFSERTLTALTGSALGAQALVPGPILHVRDFDGPSYDGVPAVGEHTADVLGAAGLSADEIARLAADGVVSG